MFSSQVAQSLKRYGDFSRSLSVISILNVSDKANTSIRSLGEDDTATSSLVGGTLRNPMLANGGAPDATFYTDVQPQYIFSI